MNNDMEFLGYKIYDKNSGKIIATLGSVVMITNRKIVEDLLNKYPANMYNWVELYL